MKRIIFLSALLLFGIYIIPNKSRSTKKVAVHFVEPIKRTKYSYVGNTKDFLEKLALFESKGSHTIVNQFGMLGKYQFSPRTLKLLGFEESTGEFLSDEGLQDSAAVLYLKNNYNYLKRTIQRYDQTWHKGILITKSGILAGAHLVGAGGVLAYFYPEKYRYPIKDGNGVPVSLYMKKFARYNISF